MNNPNTTPARQVLRVALEAAYEAAKAERSRLSDTYTDLTEEERKEMRAVLASIAKEAWKCAV